MSSRLEAFVWNDLGFSELDDTIIDNIMKRGANMFDSDVRNENMRLGFLE